MSITVFIIMITAAVSILAFTKKEYFYRFEFNPYLVQHSNQYYRFFTHALIHADWFHLFINMYVLYLFGAKVEETYVAIFADKGFLYYILLYTGGILFASLPAYKKHRENSWYNAVGASGAVSGVLFAFILFSPLSKIYLFFIPIGIPAFVFGILYLLLERYLEKKGGDNIAHDAHFWGAIFGVIFTIILEPKIGLAFLQQILSLLP